MSYLVRKADRRDAAQLEQLLLAYLRETYRRTWGGNLWQLEQDITSEAIKLTVAESGAKLIGFVAWTMTYDLHWCLKGGAAVDFYVSPAHRGTGAAMFLIADLAAEIQKSGGAFLHGGAVENENVRRLYRRIATVQPNGECYVSGRAFRHLAGLAGKSRREIVGHLPDAEWNNQP